MAGGLARALTDGSSGMAGRVVGEANGEEELCVSAGPGRGWRSICHARTMTMASSTRAKAARASAKMTSTLVFMAMLFGNHR